ncbi:ArnT family glycosyltransferase [Pseudazoarcus pumilus]|nr:glycosyltransferase family 39 protein [Pseudazoarcus pumilus]
MIDQLKAISATAFIVGIYVALRWNLLDVPLDRDEGGFAYIGQIINAGGLPYQDATDHKPPLVFYLYALAQRVFPESATGIHLFGHIYNFITLIVLATLARKITGNYAAAFFTALIFAAFSAAASLQGFTTSVALLMLLPISLSALSAAYAIEKQKWTYVLLSGFFGALACWLKPVAFFSIIPLFAWVVWKWEASPRDSSHLHTSHRRALTRIRTTAIWLSGGMLSSILVLLPFAANGLLSEVWYWTFTHNFAYSQAIDISQNLARVISWIRHVLWPKGESIPVLAALTGCVLMLSFRIKYSVFVTSFLVGSVVGTIPGHNYNHYFMQWAPAVSLAAGVALAILIANRTKFFRFSIGSLAALATLIMPLAMLPGYYVTDPAHVISRKAFGANPFPESEVLAEWLRQNSENDNTVFIYGSEPQILFLSGLRNVSRHIYMYPLLQNFERHEEFQEEAIRDIIKERPTFIVSTNVPTSLLASRSASPRFDRAITRYVQENYRPVGWIPVTNIAPEFNSISIMDRNLARRFSEHTYRILLFKRSSRE